MVIHHARKCLVDAVVDVIEHFSVPSGLPDDLRHERRGRGNHKPTGLGKDFNIIGEEPRELGVQESGQGLELWNAGVVRDGKPAADIDEV